MSIDRYSMTMEFYIYADSDKNAVDLAEHIVETQKKKWDNRAYVKSVKTLYKWSKTWYNRTIKSN